MAGQFSVTVKGADDILQRLKELGAKAMPETQQAVAEAAKIIQDEAATRVRKRTGTLAQSITISESKRKVRKAPGEASVFIGPSKEGYYGLFLELGTSKMPAYPFLVPALKASKARVKEAIARELRKGLGL